MYLNRFQSDGLSRENWRYFYVLALLCYDCRRYAKIGAAAAVGGTLLALTGGMAAPAISVVRLPLS